MLKRIIYFGLHPIIKRVRTSSLLIQLLWKVKLPIGSTVQWDTVTFVMRRALKKFNGTKGQVLEIGIGQGAINSLYFATISGKIVHGIDISDNRVNQSKVIASYNNLNVVFWKSDLFEGINGKYDVIFFNPPYVPTQKGKELELTKKLKFDTDLVWDGGIDGMKVIKGFLKDAYQYLTPTGSVLIGLQDIYISREIMLNEIKVHQYVVNNIIESSFVNLFIPTSVYEIGIARNE